MTKPTGLRSAAFLAVVVVLSGVWVAYRAVEQTQASNHSVVHTQEVLTAVETVLATVVDAENAVRSYVPSAGVRALEPLDRAERTTGANVDHLAALTADNPHQQTRVPELREATTRTLAALRVVADLKRAGRAVGPSDAVAQEAGVNAARDTIQSMRVEENRLLAERVQVNDAAVSHLQEVLIGLVVLAVGLVGLVVWLIGGNARRQRESTETLRRANEDLEVQASVRAEDLRDTNARLRSIIDSAVDGIIVIDAKGRIDAFNRGAERLFGYPEAEVIGRNVNMLMPSPDHEAHDRYLARYLETGVAKIIGRGRQVTGRRRDGTTFPLHLSVGEMSIKGERKFTGMLHDLSERMRLESRASSQRGAVAVGHRLRGGRHRRDRCAWAHRSVQSRGRTAVRAIARPTSSAATSTSSCRRPITKSTTSISRGILRRASRRSSGLDAR